MSKRAALITVTLALGFLAAFKAQEDASRPVRLGIGEHTYEWVKDWGALPGGEVLGNTHGCIVIDADDRVYVNTDTERAVVVFSPDGKLVDSWGADFKGGLHGMALVEEDGRELLYVTHTGRHQVAKLTLDGEVLWTIGYPEESGKYEKEGQYRPTSVAVREDGGFYVADGYGKSWVHEYDAEGEYVRSFGGAGAKPGEMRTPHGIWLDTRGAEPVLVVADRENHRLQTFDLEGKLLGVTAGMLRRPCHVHQRGKDLVVADLAGRVTILDGDNRLVTHLGDNPDPEKRAQNGIPVEDWQDGEFLSPHCAAWDSKGNLYVMDWNARGRVTKLKRVGE